jgi:dienelactone hydrolase
VPGRFPVLLFNHGFGSFQKQSTSLLEELASHGYVVASLGHPSESLVVQFADGTSQGRRADHPAWVEITAGLKDLEKNVRELEPLFDRARGASDPASLRDAMNAIAAHRSYAELVPLVTAWRQDTAVVLDQLAAGPLSAQVDSSQVGVFGHSLGGMVAGQLAMRDGRVKAGMSYDGAQLPLPGEVPSALRVPFCFVYADASKAQRGHQRRLPGPGRLRCRHSWRLAPQLHRHEQPLDDGARAGAHRPGRDGQGAARDDGRLLRPAPEGQAPGWLHALGDVRVHPARQLTLSAARRAPPPRRAPRGSS